jgi:hypothetical protein
VTQADAHVMTTPSVTELADVNFGPDCPQVLTEELLVYRLSALFAAPLDIRLVQVRDLHIEVGADTAPVTQQAEELATKALAEAKAQGRPAAAGEAVRGVTKKVAETVDHASRGVSQKLKPSKPKGGTGSV